MIAPSGYIEGTLDFALSGTRVMRGLTPVDFPAGVEADRARFGIPADAFVVVTSFDPRSDPERKNPQAAIEAFHRAFGDSDNARLVVKLNVPESGYADEERNRNVLQPLLQRLRADKRTVVISETLAYRDVLSLYAGADAFISLHRAEGLGLGLLESMALRQAGRCHRMVRQQGLHVGGKRMPGTSQAHPDQGHAQGLCGGHERRRALLGRTRHR